MKSLPPLRLLLALALSLGLGLLLVLILYLTDLGLRVWERLEGAPAVVWLAWVGALVLLAGAGGRLLWRALGLGRGAAPRPAAPANEAGLRARLAEAEAAGVETAAVRRELEELGRRRQAGTVVVALFGEVSAGKSSLIRALLPGAEAAVGPLAGTTRAVTRYTWTSPAGDRLVLADLPGLHEPGAALESLARDEALRAHVVVYVCDGDLTRDQFRAVQALRALDKPLILALNKSDRYSVEQLELLRRRLAERLGPEVQIVTVQAGGEEELIRELPGGGEERVIRPRPARVESLALTLQRHIDADPEALERLRDAAVFVLAHDRLDAAQAEQRRRRAEALVRGYSRKAVFGALAAVGPGTDVLIQGYLGIGMVRELAALYGAPLGEVDVQRFLTQASGQARRRWSLLLALVGNVFKAFPGLGTVVGGMLHAVAYGLIFESLGKAVAQSLETRGELAVGPALRLFEEQLSDDLEARTRRLVRLVAEQARPGPPRPPG